MHGFFYEETAGHFPTKLSGCIISRVRLLVLRLLESSSEINPLRTTALVVLRASMLYVEAKVSRVLFERCQQRNKFPLLALYRREQVSSRRVELRCVDKISFEFLKRVIEINPLTV